MNNETEQIFLLNPSELQPPVSLPKVSETSAAAQVNLENVEDFSTVCRTCATITEFVIPIFSGEGLQNSLADKIHKHLPIKVSEEDVLPRAVCYQCANTLLAWHELVACCQQADRALRTRLQQLRTTATPTQDRKPVGNENSQIVANNQQEEFEGISRHVAPPSYPGSVAGPLQRCAYCRSQHAAAHYRDHLMRAHTDLLFHCDECDAYVDRKDFILHMSFHVVEYSSGKKEIKRPNKKKKLIKDENENTDPQSPVKAEREPAELKREPIPPPKSVEDENLNVDDNEFSDHSDAEFDFGPLPESVFEAIEDSQESQRVPNEPTLTSEVTEENRVEKETNNESLKCKVVLEMINTEIKTREKEKDKPIEQIKVKKHKKLRTCPICGKVYTASSSYFYHMKSTHSTARDYECDLCGRKFTTKVILTQHMVTHSDVCENECKICGKKLKSKTSLYIHTQSHIGTKTFSCDQCKLSFRWRTHLMRHLKRHSAEKSHKCTTCGRGFKIHCDLLRHMRTHSAGKFDCKKCGVSFAQARYLKAHMDKKHSAQAVLAQGALPVASQNESRR